jgi:hypothetical protein
MKKILFSIIFVTILSFGCTEDNMYPNAKNSGGITLSLGSENDQVLQNYLGNFDLTNIVGIVELQKLYINDMDSTTPYQVYTHNVFTNFYDDNGDKLELGSIGVNGKGLIDAGEFSYQLNPQTTNLSLNYGTGSNTIIISDTSGVNILDTTITFNSPLLLSNFSYMQNYSKSQNKTITWTGTDNNSITQFNLRTDSYVRDADTTSNTAGIESYFFTNNGSHVLEKEIISELKNGKTRIIFTKVELKVLPLTNGKKVAVIGRSTYDSYVNITN